MSRISEFSPDGGTTTYGIKDSMANLFLTCTTTRSTRDKVVACEGFELFTGVMIAIRFTSVASSDPSSGELTLNVNDTGAKTIVRGKSKTPLTNSDASMLMGDNAYVFSYDGTYWVMLNSDAQLGVTTEYDATTKTLTLLTGSPIDLTGADVNNVMLVTESEL